MVERLDRSNPGHTNWRLETSASDLSHHHQHLLPDGVQAEQAQLRVARANAKFDHVEQVSERHLAATGSGHRALSQQTH